MFTIVSKTFFFFYYGNVRMINRTPLNKRKIFINLISNKCNRKCNFLALKKNRDNRIGVTRSWISSCRNCGCGCRPGSHNCRPWCRHGWTRHPVSRHLICRPSCHFGTSEVSAGAKRSQNWLEKLEWPPEEEADSLRGLFPWLVLGTEAGSLEGVLKRF